VITVSDSLIIPFVRHFDEQNSYYVAESASFVELQFVSSLSKILGKLIFCERNLLLFSFLPVLFFC